MKISIDAAALCGKNPFGNYIFTENLIKAIKLYDFSNKYFLYSFCRKPLWVKTDSNFHYLKLTPKLFWLAGRVTWEELFRPKDVFLALNQAIPLFVRGKIISFSHGLSFQFFPQYYPRSHHYLKSQLKKMIKKSSYLVVSSKKVKRELLAIASFPQERIKILPFGIPFDMKDKVESHNQKTLKNKDKYFLYVGMNHPIKNINFLKKTIRYFPGYKLYQVHNLSRVKLKKLYQKATALLTASFYESFNLPVLEALSQGCPVVGLKSAIVPELSPFVLQAEDFQEFVYQMKMVIEGKVKEIDKKKLYEKFSWENYVKKLIELYD